MVTFLLCTDDCASDLCLTLQKLAGTNAESSPDIIEGAISSISFLFRFVINISVNFIKKNYRECSVCSVMIKLCISLVFHSKISN